MFCLLELEKKLRLQYIENQLISSSSSLVNTSGAIKNM